MREFRPAFSYDTPLYDLITDFTGFGKVLKRRVVALLNIGSIFDGGEEMRANIRGELPILLKNVGFKVKKLNGRYRGTEFLQGEKI